ncbi:hypothetical protein EDD16DRAFT_1663025 [Pisolithus croceorrhizus]|nr:hypothetical protein EDD16DRAFT_1663025 [Pisolithus croceorrhizus]KAI6115410.1 hypothetical protein EV401DRAFT_1976335 [Pisolithus croceorrhizus]KAI6164086.1 hypothetical protein EDD17DRAFT_415214 [Pisolithus thermaeus]
MRTYRTAKCCRLSLPTFSVLSMCSQQTHALMCTPIQLLITASTYFTSEVFDLERGVPPAFVRHVRKAVKSFVFIHCLEVYYRNLLTSILLDIIGHLTIITSDADGTSPDGVVVGSHRQTECAHLVAYEKREFGDGMLNPSTQRDSSLLCIFC